MLIGNEKMAANVKEMLGHYPQRWWLICWKFISPLLILVSIEFRIVEEQVCGMEKNVSMYKRQK